MTTWKIREQIWKSGEWNGAFREYSYPTQKRLLEAAERNGWTVRRVNKYVYERTNYEIPKTRREAEMATRQTTLSGTAPKKRKSSKKTTAKKAAVKRAPRPRESRDTAEYKGARDIAQRHKRSGQQTQFVRPYFRRPGY